MAHQHQKGHTVLKQVQLPHESKQSPSEKNAMFKRVQRPKQDVKSISKKILPVNLETTLNSPITDHPGCNC